MGKIEGEKRFGSFFTSAFFCAKISWILFSFNVSEWSLSPRNWKIYLQNMHLRRCSWDDLFILVRYKSMRIMWNLQKRFSTIGVFTQITKSLSFTFPKKHNGQKVVTFPIHRRLRPTTEEKEVKDRLIGGLWWEFMGTMFEGFHRKRKSKETSSKLFGLNPCLRFFEGLKKSQPYPKKHRWQVNWKCEHVCTEIKTMKIEKDFYKTFWIACQNRWVLVLHVTSPFTVEMGILPIKPLPGPLC